MRAAVASPPRSARSLLLREITEAQLQDKIIDYALLRGWLVNHSRPARTARGWRTAIQGHAGWPDLQIARRGRLVVAELKSTSGRLSPAQRAWVGALPNVPGVAEVYVWTPESWPEIEATLA